MNINGINIPDTIIEAIKHDKLVVFAGAGVSMNHPTNLVGFDGLVEKITENTGYEYQTSEYKSKPDVFLGMLEHEGVEVKELASNYFKSKKIHYSQMHKNILSLFNKKENIRLVTTNYEYAFEKALGNKHDINIYSYPALPSGNDFKGIVHIHGVQDDPKNMILTDSDFGKAYLLDGIASNFLIRMFQEYTVLFIGYSHEDVIMSYFSRGLPSNLNAERYIFIGEESSTKWELYGLKPIYFPKGDYECQTKILKSISERAHRNFMSWNSKIEYITQILPSNSLESIDEIKEIVNSRVLLKTFIDKFDVKLYKEWFNWFHDHNVLYFLEKEEITIEENMFCSWLIKVDICNYNFNNFRQLISRNQKKLSGQFYNSLFQVIIAEHTSIDDGIFEYLVILFKNELTDIEETYKWRIIELCFEKGLNNTGYYVYFENLRPRLVLEENLFYFKESNQFEVKYDEKIIYKQHRIWEHYIEKDIEVFGEKIYNFSKDKIEDQKRILSTLNGHNNRSYYRFMFIDIENDWLSKQEGNYDNLLFKMLYSSLVNFWLKKKKYGKIIGELLNSDSLLIQKIALINLKNNEYADNNFKIELIQDYPLYNQATKMEIFRLIKKIYIELDLSNRKILIDRILSKLDKTPLNEFDNYEVYNWLIWLQKDQVDDNIIKDTLAKHQSYFANFQPRSSPELNISISNPTWSVDKIPINIDELNNMKILELLDYIDSIEGEHISFSESYSSKELFDVIMKKIKVNTPWRMEIINHMINNEIYTHTLWHYVLRGLDKASITLEQFEFFIKELIDINLVKNYGTLISNMLYDVLRNEMVEKHWILNREEDILRMINLLYVNPSYNIKDEESYISTALNGTSFGVVKSFLRLLSLDKYENGISGKYKSYILKFLDKNYKDAKYTTPIIFGDYNLIYVRDNIWFKEEILPILLTENKHIFNASWEGLLAFNPVIYTDKAALLIESFREASKRFQWFQETNKVKFTDVYTVLIFHFVKNPVNEYNKFLLTIKNNDEDKILIVLNTINRMLENIDNTEKLNKTWNVFLLKVLENSNKNVPKKYNDTEILYIIRWIVYSKLKFNEASNLVLKFPFIFIEDIYLVQRLLSDISDIYPEDEYSDARYNILIFFLQCTYRNNISEFIFEEYIISLGEIKKSNKLILKEKLIEIGLDIDLRI